MDKRERPAATAAVVSKLTNEFLERVAMVAIAMEGDDQANGIAFALACYELAGKEAPDFGRLAEGE